MMAIVKYSAYKDMDPKDHFYGFGEKTGFLNKRGAKNGNVEH